MTSSIEAALQDFILEDVPLERLEAGLSEVNFFEATGAVRSERRHSDFLAYLLDPRGNHGLGDKFLKRIAQRALSGMNSGSSSLSPLKLGVWDLESSSVERESDNTDILIVNEANKFVIVVENKIQSGEHSDQLNRYQKAIAVRYPNHSPLFLFLSVDGDIPSHADYVPLSYSTVCQIVEELLKNRVESLYPDVAVLLRHYKTLLRRHFMEEDELAVLAQSIYKKHKIALDYILEKRPDFQAAIKSFLELLIKNSSDLAADYSSKSSVRFAPQEWAEDELLVGEGWTPSRRMLLFEFRNLPDRVTLALIIGPGNADVRKQLFEFARSNLSEFKLSGQTLYSKWNQIWSKKILSASDLDSQDMEIVSGKLTKTWEQFRANELPGLRRAIQEWRASLRVTPR